MITIESSLEEESWWGDATSTALPDAEEDVGPVRVAHVADRYNGYPGETITFYTRLEAREAVAGGVTVRVMVPPGLSLTEYASASEQSELLPTLEVDSAQNRYVVWALNDDLPAGSRSEYRASAEIEPTQEALTLTSRATVSGVETDLPLEETVSVVVRPTGRYVQHLPAIYERDELMGRFLMLFESFWKPINQQIDTIHYYFDPRITPADFLPWLASWLDLELDERWPVNRQRQLIRWAIALHRSRGTKWGLLKYLEIYTGQQADIVERRARNFILGKAARMGPGIALGQGNRPHTFTVNLRLPPIEAPTEKEQKRLEAIRRRTIESIIEMQKPAHTVYTLNIEPLSSADRPEAKNKTAQSEQRKQNEIAAQAAIWFKLDD